MKLCLGMMVHNEAQWLQLHLPVIAACFDGMIFVSDPTNDEATRHELTKLRYFYPEIYYFEYPFNDNWSEMYNHAIDHAEWLNYDAIIRLDPDELVFPNDIEAARELLEEYTILCFARINYWKDRLHYTPGVYPDWQARAWQLNRGIRIGGKRHEGIGWTQYGMYEGDPLRPEPRQVLRVPSIQIHHYGDIGDNIYNRALKYTNYDRVDRGLPPIDKLPEGARVERHHIPYRGQQPIDPYAIGATAPFEEVIQ